MKWKNIIADLQAFGLTQSQIAEKCGTGQSHISSLASGKRKVPNWNLGDALIRLHKKVLKNNKAA